MKIIGIDLVKLRNINCGLGQVAHNFAIELSKYQFDGFKFDFVLPKQYIGYYGNNVDYEKYSRVKKYLPFTFKNYNIWHSTNQYIKYFPINKKTKKILTIHDLNPIYENPNNIKKYIRKLQRIIDKVDYITTISNFVKDDLENHLKINKPTKVIYNAINDLTKIPPIKPPFIVDGKPFFFTIGQVLKKKNFHTLLPLMKLLPDFHLYISGQSNTAYAEDLKHQIIKDKITNITLTDVITEEEKAWLYRNNNAFLFPSLFEGFGLPILEALQFGNVVIASKSTSIPEIGKDYISYFNSFDPNDMKEVILNSIEYVKNNPNHKTISKNYAKSFSYPEHTQEYIELYKELL